MIHPLQIMFLKYNCYKYLYETRLSHMSIYQEDVQNISVGQIGLPLMVVNCYTWT